MPLNSRDQISNVDSGLGENDITATLARFNTSMTNTIIEGRAITSQGTADSRWWHLYIYRPVLGNEMFILKEGETVSGLGYMVEVFKVAS